MAVTAGGVLDALDRDLAAQMARIEARRRVIGWLHENAEEAVMLGFAVTCEVRGEDGVTLRIDWAGGEPAEPEPHPDEDAAAALAAKDEAGTPAQEAGEPSGAGTGGGGGPGAAPVAVGAYGASWSEDENIRLVAGVVERVRGGMSLRRAALDCVPMFPGRTPASVEQRAREKLKARIDMALKLAAIQASGPHDAPPEAVVSVTPAGAPAFTPVDGLPLWQRNLSAVLDGLGNADPFTPEVDLALIEALARGLKLPQVAEDLDLPEADLRRRAKALLPESGLAAQQNLLTELRRRVARVQGVAA